MAGAVCAGARGLPIPDAQTAPGTPLIAEPASAIGGRSSGLLMSGDRGGDVAGAVTWTVDGWNVDRSTVTVRFVVEVDGEMLLADSPPEPVPVDVVAYVLDERDALVEHVASSVTLESASQRSRVVDAGLKHMGAVTVPDRRCSLRILVLNRATGRYFLDRLDLESTRGTDGAPDLLPPLVAETSGRWYATVQPGLTTSGPGNGPTDPRAWPSARPAWRTDRSLNLAVTGAAVAEGNPLRVRLEDRAGGMVLEPRVDIGSVTTDASGTGSTDVAVDAPRLPTGVYRVVVSVDDGTGDRSIERSLSVLIHDGAEDLVWADSVVVPEVPEQPSAAAVVEADGSPRADADDSGEDPVIEGVAATPPVGPPMVAVPISGVDAFGAALLMSGQSGGDIDGSVTWSVDHPVGSGDGIALRFVIEVSGESLLVDSPLQPMPIEFDAYLLDDRGELISHAASGLVLDDPGVGSWLRLHGLKYVGGLTAPAGRSSLRVLVRNRASGRYLLVRRELDLELGPDGTPVLLPPMVAEPAGMWLRAVQPGLEVTDDHVGPQDPHVWPSARPVWRADQPLSMIVGGSAVAEGRPIRTRLEDRLGRVVLEPRIRLDQPTGNETDNDVAHAEVEAPDLPNGEYRLVMAVDESSGERAIEQELSVVIHDRPGEVAWTDLEETTDEPGAVVAVEADDMSGRRLEHESMRAAYLAGLRAWAEDDRVAARRIVNDLESPVASTKGTRAWRELVAAQGSVLSELASGRPGVLVAAVLLHRDMYYWYLARGEGALARHSWESAALLAIEAEDLDDWQPPAGFTEAVLLDLADHLVQARQPDAARQLLEEAEKIAPSSPRPLLALGALAERSGRLEDAIRPLKRLVELEPDHFEARLRLAVCRARVGDEKDAEELFRGLLAAEVPSWIRALAFQELGRLLITTGRVNDAADVLREGSSAVPDNQRMRILLAHALDAAGRPGQAASVLAGVEARTVGGNESPRYRYSRWPALDRAHVQSVLSGAETIARDALRQAAS
jgi:Flp pilus assembly protein TadD/phage baseplate assembly protein W